MTNYFVNCKTLDELKKAYKAAAKPPVSVFEHAHTFIPSGQTNLRTDQSKGGVRRMNRENNQNQRNQQNQNERDQQNRSERNQRENQQNQQNRNERSQNRK